MNIQFNKHEWRMTDSQVRYIDDDPLSVEVERHKAVDSQVGELGCDQSCSTNQGRGECPLTCPFKTVRPASRFEEFLGTVCLIAALLGSVGLGWWVLQWAKGVM